MNVTYACPKCDVAQRTAVDPTADRLTCGKCGYVVLLSHSAAQEQPLDRCLVCRCDELYIRKDFSQRLGVTIIVTGFILSSIAWFYYKPIWSYAILGASALVDFVMYLLVGNVLQCYRCHSEYRGVPGLDEHEPFSLETHERYRQQAARLEQASGASSKQVT